MNNYERQFVDEMGLVFDYLGAPRMMGRIVGWLLICDPPHQSEAQLCAHLSASKGAVNTLTRQLVQMRLVQRVVVAGERATFVQIRSDGWMEMLRQKLGMFDTMQQLARDGLTLLADAPKERRLRLQRFHDFYDYMGREVGPLIDRFKEER